jgi:hypothetical protein
MPEIPIYTGLGDLIEHLASFRSHIVLHATPDEVACVGPKRVQTQV